MTEVKIDENSRAFISAEITKARDALNRARDGLPEIVHEDVAFLDYSDQQLQKAITYALRARTALRRLRTHTQKQLAQPPQEKGRSA